MRTPIQRFLEKIEIDDNDCWNWNGAKIWQGYGLMGLNYKTVLSHRFIFEYCYGSIPKDKELDHLCRNHCCCNPLHLEAVTREENLKRGNHRNQNTLKTNCIHGHEFILENTYIDPKGWRVCRECKRIWERNYRKKQKISSILKC